MTQRRTADLLNRAAVRLSLAYFAELEKERDSRWDGDIEQADSFRDEAEEIRHLADECRAAADRLLSDDTPLRDRARRRDDNGLTAASH